MVTLQKVIYLNVDVLTLRREGVEKNLREMGVPEDKIHRFRGIDASDYTNRDELVAAAVADGFPKMIHMRKGLGNGGYCWSIRRVLRYITKVGTCLVMTDDARLTKEWSEYKSVVENAGDFDILQFGKYENPSDRKWYTAQFKNRLNRVFEPSICSFDQRFCYGILYVGEFANVYSAEGASKLLHILEHPEYAGDGIQTINLVYEYGILLRTLSVVDNSDVWARDLGGVHEQRYASYLEEVNQLEKRHNS